ncbi:MAG: hypothetical protein ACOY3P_06140 [Planctomycetota bacterium]
MTSPALPSLSALLYFSLAVAPVVAANAQPLAAAETSTESALSSADSPAPRSPSAVASPEIAGLRVGFGGAYKAGLWTPVEVLLRGADGLIGAELVFTVPDGEGVPSRISTTLSSGLPRDAAGNSVVRLVARFGRVTSTASVELRQDGRVLTERRFAASRVAKGDFPPALQSQKLIVVVGPDSLGVDDAIGLQGLEADRRPVVALVGSVDALPDRWIGYEGVDALVIATADPASFAGWQGGDPRAQALVRWIESGGKLLLTAGSRAETVFADASPLAPLAPGKLARMMNLRQTTALESFARSASPVPAPAPGETAGLRVGVFEDVRGVIEAREGNLPLVIRMRHGFGQVIFFGGDLELSPLAEWADRRFLVARLLDLPTTLAADEDQRGSVMHGGYTDLAGQLRSALDQFTGIQLISFWAVAAAVIAYVLIIGPLDYYLVRRVVKRPWLTWVTSPLIVVAFSLAAYAIAVAYKGEEIRSRQIELVDIEASTGLARGTSWLGFFSPRVAAYDIRIEPRTPEGEPTVEDRFVAWLGLPGSALGGMEAGGAEAMLWPAGYQFGPGLKQIEGLPLAAWSSRSLTARWIGHAEPGIEANLVDEGEIPTGSIINRMPVGLERCLLAYGTWAYELGAIEAGGAVTLNMMSRRSELKTLLTGWRIVFQGGQGDRYRQEATPYDPASTDAAYALRMMSFYDAAGGKNYVGLTNDYQGFVDFTDLLKTGCAVLVAELPDDGPSAKVASRWIANGRPLVDPEEGPLVVLRLVIPVKKNSP